MHGANEKIKKRISSKTSVIRGIQTAIQAEQAGIPYIPPLLLLVKKLDTK